MVLDSSLIHARTSSQVNFGSRRDEMLDADRDDKGGGGGDTDKNIHG